MLEVGAAAVTSAITAAQGPAVCAYVTAGYPNKEVFGEILHSVARAADVVEVGVPFSDPMADGHTIQRSSATALRSGVTLAWILETLTAEREALAAPCLLMGYYNPFLAFGLEQLGKGLAAAGVSGVIVPDLPFEESLPLRGQLEPHGLAVVQLVTPTTPGDRLARLAGVSQGFVYAVTTTGVTGGTAALGSAQLEYLDRVRAVAPTPVLAGFGVRTADDVSLIGSHVDGVVVGSALLEAIDRGDDPGEFIASLRLAGAVR